MGWDAKQVSPVVSSGYDPIDRHSILVGNLTSDPSGPKPAEPSPSPSCRLAGGGHHVDCLESWTPTSLFQIVRLQRLAFQATYLILSILDGMTDYGTHGTRASS